MSEPVEQAVIVRFDYLADDLDPLMELEDRLVAAIDSAGVGEYDGNDIAADRRNCRLFFYGPDAERLWTTIRPLIATATCMRAPEGTLRFGPLAEETLFRLEKITPPEE